MSTNKTVGFLLKRVDCNDGISSHCETLIRGLKTAGWHVVIISGPITHDPKSEKRFKTIKGLVDDWVVIENMNLVMPSLSCLNHIKRIIDKYNITVLHAHGYAVLILAYLLKLLTGISCTATYHPSLNEKSSISSKGNSFQIQAWKYRFFLSLFTPYTFIACSSEIETFLTSFLQFSKRKVRKILLGVDTEYFVPPSKENRFNIRNNLGFSEDDIVCILVGRLNWVKGHDVLINAVRRLRSHPQIPRIKCIFVGSGPEENLIKNYAFNSVEDSETFHFFDYLYEIRDLYWAADIFVLPSRVEGFALVVAEAMCCGLVPIRTAGGGSSDQIDDGVNGYVIPLDDDQVLAAQLLKLSEDHSLRQQLAEAAKCSARQKFSAFRMVQNTVKVYEEIDSLTSTNYSVV